MKKETYSPFLAFLLCLLASTALWAAGGKPTSALKKNILEQAGQAMLTQANQSRQGIVSLLG